MRAIDMGRKYVMLWRHPHLSVSVVTARLAVCLATLIWAGIAYLAPAAMRADPLYDRLLHYGAPAFWAGAMFLAGVVQLSTTLAHSPPDGLDTFASLLMSGFWTWAVAATAIETRPIPIISLSAGVAIVLLSLWNSLAVSRTLDDASG